VTGTINVLQAARASSARVVFASTGGAIYGEDAVRPTPESAACEPEAPYGTAKLCAEEYVRLFNRLHGSRHAILRLGNVYGPRQDPSGEAGVVSIFAGRVVRGERPTVFGDGRRPATTSTWAMSCAPSWRPPTPTAPGSGTSGPGARSASST
jgi:UDP-glucose 4-epimerase